MSDALVGHSGFVGSNLAAQHRFDAQFNSSNIEEASGRGFSLLVVSGMPGAKWLANREPGADRAALDRLVGCLRGVVADRVVVVSTVDVYPFPLGVDEDTLIDLAAQQPYGRHRLMLEHALADLFPRVLAVRLPGLFGPGLKKNVIYDLLHNHQITKIHSASVFQFYPLARLWTDVQTALTAGLGRVNLATEPVGVREVAREAFGLDFHNDPGTPPVRYDMRSKHASLFGGRRGYLCTRGQVLRELAAFVRREKGDR